MGYMVDPFQFGLNHKNQLLPCQWFETWLELMHNKPSMLQHSKNLGHTLDLFIQMKGFGQVRSESFGKERLEIQKTVENQPNLDQHDQIRKQT